MKDSILKKRILKYYRLWDSKAARAFLKERVCYNSILSRKAHYKHLLKEEANNIWTQNRVRELSKEGNLLNQMIFQLKIIKTLKMLKYHTIITRIQGIETNVAWKRANSATYDSYWSSNNTMKINKPDIYQNQKFLKQPIKSQNDQLKKQ